MTVTVHQKAKAKKPARAQDKPKMRSITAATLPLKIGAVVDLRQRLQLSQAVFARFLSVSVRTLASLERGSPPSESVARRWIELLRLTNALAEVIKKESLGKWLQTPNEAFDGLKPLEIVDRGEGDRIWSMIYFLRSGVPS